MNIFCIPQFLTVIFIMGIKVLSQLILITPFLASNRVIANSTKEIETNLVICPSLKFANELKVWVKSKGFSIHIIIFGLFSVIHVHMWTQKVFYKLYLRCIEVIVWHRKINSWVICTIYFSISCTLLSEFLIVISSLISHRIIH